MSSLGFESGLALAHSVLSFVFNIAIVALAINIAAGLL